MSMTELERQRAHYKEIRDRIWAAKPKPKVSPASSIKTVPAKQWKPDLPMWRETDIHFDAHVTDFRIWQVDQASPKRAYLRDRAIEMGTTLKAILTGGRKRGIIAKKHLLIWEVKWLWPKTTFPELCRLFKLGDHTTAISAIKKLRNQMVCDL